MNAIDRLFLTQEFVVSTAVTMIVAGWFTLAFAFSLIEFVAGA